MLPEKNKRNLLIGVTGSVATIKLRKLVEMMQEQYNIKIVLSQKSKHFLSGEGELGAEFREKFPIYEDAMEWETWKGRSDPVLHIELRKWSDCFLIAPLSANTLAKLANGLCDNLITLVCRCWNMKKNDKGTLMTPILICPAMNTMMWQHPITNNQLSILKEWGYTIAPTVEKTLVCGDTGKGAMLEIENIKEILQNLH